jgi:FSR family fosmidomycin resistance protein-like MFS transporter
MKESTFQSRRVIAISSAHLLHDIFSSFLAPLLPLLIGKLGISYTVAGLLNVINRLPMLLNPFLGLLADRIHLRYVVIFTPLTTAIAASLMGLAPGVTFLAILIFVMGLSAALFHVPSPVMVRRVSGDKIGRGMSYYMFGGEAARTIGPVIVLGAVSAWGIERIYNLIPVAVLFTLFLYYMLKDIAISDEVKQHTEKLLVKATIKKYSLFFLLLAGYMVFFSMLKSAITAFLPTFLTSQGKSVWFGGIALATLELAGAAGTLLSGTLSDKFGRKKILLISTIASPVVFWLFLLSPDMLKLPFIALVGLFLFAGGPVLLAMIQDLGSDRPAFLNSIYMTISFLVGALAMLVLGLLGDMFGLLQAYRIVTILSLFSIPFTVALTNHTAKRHRKG